MKGAGYARREYIRGGKMLHSLHVKNLALIDETEVTFGEGLNILTGETGAGKSIIIGSINLALGAKADTEMIRIRFGTQCQSGYGDDPYRFRVCIGGVGFYGGSTETA